MFRHLSNAAGREDRNLRGMKERVGSRYSQCLERMEERRLMSVVAPTASPPHTSGATPALTVTQSAPVIGALPAATVNAGSTLTYQVTATGSPAPTFSLSSPPSGMVINSTTGLITWTPTLSQAGTKTIYVRATNSVGSASKSFAVTVTKYVAPAITAPTSLSATLGGTLGYQLVATGTPAPAFSLVSGPAGLNVSPTGFMSWSPVSAALGVQAVTVSAANVAGTATSTFNLSVAPDTTPPTAPYVSLGPIVSTSQIPLSWSGSTDDVGVAGYRVYFYTPAVYKGHSGRGGGYTLVSPAKYTLIADVGATTSYTVTGLLPDSTHQYAVAAYDAAGNQSAYSALVTGTTLLTPGFTWSLYGPDTDPAMSVVANHPLSFLIYTTGNPSPTLSVLSAPNGVVFTPGQVTNSQLTYVTPNIAWTPTADEVGVNFITIQATNSVGTYTQSIPVTVTPDTPQISLSINGGITYGPQQYAAGQSNYVVNVNPAYGNSAEPQYGLSGAPFNFQVSSATNTNPTTYALLSAPDGMTLDPDTGVGTWAPTKDQAGNTSVTIAATNDAGTSTLELSFPTYFTGAPGTPAATYYTSTSGALTANPTIDWAAPADTVGIADYKIAVTAANSNALVTFDTQGTATSYALSGLVNQQYFVTVTPYDANGNPGITSPAVSIYEAGLSNVTWSYGQQNAIVGTPATIQFGTSSSLALTYSLVSGPAGATIDPNTGLLSWTPTDPGNAQIIIATNAPPLYNWGTVDAVLNVPVYFADAPTSLAVSGGVATWAPPALNASLVAGYQVQVVSPTAATPITIALGPSDPLIVSLSDMGVTTGSVQVSAIDASGNASVASPWVSF